MPDTPRQYGYDHGDPFGDPSKFTRSTGEDEINRFNEWMRSQPWWQTVRAQAGEGDMNDVQQKQVVAAARAQGINVPSAFHIDEAGNFNQKSRTTRNLIIGAAVVGSVVTAGMLAAAAAPAAGGGAAAAGGVGSAAAGGTLASTAIGSGFIPAVAGGSGLASLGGGAAAAATGGISAAGAASAGAGALGAVRTGSRLLGAAQAGSRMLGAFGESEAQNRGSQAELALARDRMQLDARQDTRVGESDALRKLAQTNYILNHKDTPLPPGARDYGFRQPVGDAQRQSAQVLQDTAQKRIADGGFQPQNYQDQYGKPGKGERLAGLLSPALGLIDIFGRR